MGSSDFNPQSSNAMFATILADLKAAAEFREQVIKRFDDGTARMDAQDVVLGDIKTQTIKTNGRVDRFEDAALDKRVAKLEKTKERAAGSWVVLTIIGAAILAIGEILVLWIKG